MLNRIVGGMAIDLAFAVIAPYC